MNSQRPEAPPLTIAINGAFGIGKSSVALLTQYLPASKLEDRGEKRHVTAWMLVGRYRGSSSLRASFVRDFVRDLYYAQSQARSDHCAAATWSVSSRRGRPRGPNRCAIF